MHNNTMRKYFFANHNAICAPALLRKEGCGEPSKPGA